MRAGALLILIVLTAAVGAAAAWVVIGRDAAVTAADPAPEPMFPELQSHLDRLAEIRISDAARTVTLARGEGDRWTLREKADYPVRGDAVRQAVAGLAGLQRLEPRTARPEFYDRLDLSDLDQPGSKAARIVLVDAAGQQLAALLVGRTESVATAVKPASLFVRRPGEAQSWLATGRLEVKADPMHWLDPELFKVPRDRVMSVEVVHADGERVAAARAAADQEQFSVDGLPDGASVKQAELNGLASALEFVMFEDVAPAAAVDFTGASLATVRTFDGLAVTVRTVMRDGKPWSRFEAAFDAAQAEATRAAGGASAQPPEAVRDAASAIAARLAPWAYQVPDYRAAPLTRRPADLVQKDAS